MSKLALLLAAALAAAACTDTYEYEPATAGEAEGEGDRQPRTKTATQFVRGLYADLLGRTPETFELMLSFNGVEQPRIPLNEEAIVTRTIEGLGDSLPMRNLVAKGLLHSAGVTIPAKASVEDPRAYIREQFRRLLGREPNAYELEQFAGEWTKDPAVGPRTIIRAIVGSREYQSQ